MQSHSPPFIFEHVGDTYIRPEFLEDHEKIQGAIYALFYLIRRDLNYRNKELKERSFWEHYIPNNSMNMSEFIRPACRRLNLDPDIICQKILDAIYLDENDIAWYFKEINNNEPSRNRPRRL